MTNFTEPVSEGTAQGCGETRPAARRAAFFSGKTAWGLLLLWVVLGLTRFPLIPASLYSFDSVNFALALEDFDPTRNQPQPPGYPLFVAEERILYPLLGSPEHTFALLQIATCALAIALLFFLGRMMFSDTIGWVAAALFLVNPIVWCSSLTSPLRPHLAVFSLLVALFCWQALSGNHRSFYWATVALGVGGGFRPELCLTLLPLWLWAAWRTGGMRTLLKGSLLLAGLIWIWLSNLAMACGGFTPMIQSFRDYAGSQTFQTAAFEAGPGAGWRHMAGRVLVWSTLGALPWIWALPFAWLKREQWPQWRLGTIFLIVWTAPAVLFYVAVHSADPDHILPLIPTTCLVGAFSLEQAQVALRGRFWPGHYGRYCGVLLCGILTAVLILQSPPPWRFGYILAAVSAIAFALVWLLPRGWCSIRGAAISIALLGNIIIFMGQFPFPQGPSGGRFRGLSSLGDAYLGGIYESSYRRIQWVSDVTAIVNDNLPKLKRSAPGPTILIWSRDGEPVWRKIAYYFPADKIYVLDESGDPSVPTSQAGLWIGNGLLAHYAGETPIQLPIPRGARLVWFMGGGRFDELSHMVPLHKIFPFAYTDLPADSPAFQWGSFRFVPQ